MESRPGILILTAIAMEHRHVVQACLPAFYDDPVPDKGEPVGPIGKWDVSVKMIGIRALGLGSIEIPADCKLIIMAGLAGGLDPTLGIGDVIAAGAPDWVRIPERVSSTRNSHNRSRGHERCGKSRALCEDPRGGSRHGNLHRSRLGEIQGN